MQVESRDAASSSTGRLPWILSFAVLALYWVTASRWMTIQSLATLSQIAGWDGNLPAGSPLLFLLSRPLTLLPSGSLPSVANLLTALLAAGTAWMITRTILILPRDRTHTQRIRGYSDGRPMEGRWAWLPPVLAVGVFAFQRTVWEHGTSMTGEMLNAFLFASIARALMEYRATRRERWLDLFAVLLGIGIPNDWALLGFLPAFLLAFFWIGGFEILRTRLLLRLAGIGAVGLSLYLLIPAVGAGKSGLPDSFGEALWALITTQKDILLGISKFRFLMLGSVMLVPLLAAGFRGDMPRGSGLEQIATLVALTGIQFVWLGAILFMSFDGPFSPRALVTLNPEVAALPLLTFHVGAALSVGYLSGYFLIVGLVPPGPQWARVDGAGYPIHRALAWCVIATLAVPAALLVKNWNGIRIQNGPVLDDMARVLVEPLPARPAVIVTDNPILESLANAHFSRTPGSPAHLVFNTRRAADASYRRHLARTRSANWPELKDLAATSENVGGQFLALLIRSSLTNVAYSFGPTVSFLTEPTHLQPAGAIFRFQAYASGQVQAPPISAADAAAVAAFWNSRREALERLLVAAQDPSQPTPRFVASFYGRAANAQGIALQRAGLLDPASQLFATARKLDPDNPSAIVNAAVNDLLRRRLPIDAALRKPIESLPYSALGIDTYYGPVDEPRHLEALGTAVLELPEPLVRAAANAFLRARELDPTSIDAAIGYARACVAANEPALALKAVSDTTTLARDRKLTLTQSSLLAQAEANAHLRAGAVPAAEAVALRALSAQPNDVALLDLVSFIYVQSGSPAKAIPYVNRILKANPQDEATLQRRGYLLLQAGQFDAAVADFDEVLNRRFDDNTARMNRATAHLFAGRADKAAEDFQIALRRDAKAVDALVGLAEANLLRKDRDAALRYFDKALAAVDTRSVVHSNLTARIKSIRTNP